MRKHVVFLVIAPEKLQQHAHDLRPRQDKQVNYCWGPGKYFKVELQDGWRTLKDFGVGNRAFIYVDFGGEQHDAWTPPRAPIEPESEPRPSPAGSGDHLAAGGPTRRANAGQQPAGSGAAPKKRRGPQSYWSWAKHRLKRARGRAVDTSRDGRARHP